MPVQNDLILWFKDIHKEDAYLVGKKAVSLSQLQTAGFPTPNGFCLTTKVYQAISNLNNLEIKIEKHLHHANYLQPQDIKERAQKIKQLIRTATIPNHISLNIAKAYNRLSNKTVTITDTTNSTLHTHYATGDANLIQAVRTIWAQQFTDKALFIRHKNRLGHPLPTTCIQNFHQPEISGTISTQDLTTGNKNTAVIESVWGISHDSITTVGSIDTYHVNKSDLSIRHQQTSTQKYLYQLKQDQLQKSKLSTKLQSKAKLTQSQVKFLAQLAIQVQQHKFFPQQIFWIYSKNRFYITNIKELTKNSHQTPQTPTTKSTLKQILKSEPASPGIVSGPARVIGSTKELHKLKSGEILVIPLLTPDYAPVTNKTIGIVTDMGGQTSHAVIIARELGLPCLINAKSATNTLKTGHVYTIDGSTGKIFQGALPAKTTKPLQQPSASNFPAKPTTIKKTATKLYVSISNPQLATKISKLDVDGLGLIRGEILISKTGIHPKQLINKHRSELLLEYITNSLQTFSKSFGNRPVFYQLSNLTSDYYCHLTGGKHYEPKENNPIFGFHGLLRHLNDPKALNLELQALKNARDLGATNLNLIVPFARTPRELAHFKKILAAKNLIRSSHFKIHLAIDNPATVIDLQSFIKVGIDGININTNDLTTFILSLDPDNSETYPYFNPFQTAVQKAISSALKTAQKANLASTVTVQAATHYLDLVSKLVSWNTNNISVAPKALTPTRRQIYHSELSKLKKV